MPKSSKKPEQLSMDTEQFILIWKKSLERSIDDIPSQRDWMVEQCLNLFLLTDNPFSRSNAGFLSEHPHSTEEELDALKSLVGDRVYSKCSNLRTKFKKVGYKEPDFPSKGVSKATQNYHDYASLLGLKPN